MTGPEHDGRPGPDPEAFAVAVGALGVPCSVEARGGLALLIPSWASVAKLQKPEARRAVLGLAREHGFTHVGIELPSDRTGAGARDADAPLLRD